jgi:hypothetical protein
MEALKYKHSFMNLRNWQHTRKQLNSLNHKAHEVGVIIPGLKNDRRAEMATPAYLCSATQLSAIKWLEAGSCYCRGCFGYVKSGEKTLIVYQPGYRWC